jgi:hypothetical protein
LPIFDWGFSIGDWRGAGRWGARGLDPFGRLKVPQRVFEKSVLVSAVARFAGSGGTPHGQDAHATGEGVRRLRHALRMTRGAGG